MDDPTALVGRWLVRREIDDRRDAVRHRLTGTLEITPGTTGLDWQESLTWHRPGGDLEVARRLRLVQVEGRWWVRFEDGRDFHPWVTGERVTHPCAPDTYSGLVEGDRSRWTVEWVASGPAKDYTMTSVMTLAGDGSLSRG